MKKILLIVLCAFFLVGCAYKVNTATLAIPTDTINHEYYTYDEKESKITAYFFKNEKGVLQVSSYITFLPYDEDGLLYSPFSSLKRTLDRYTNYKSTTIEDILEVNMSKNGFKRLYKDKPEYLIDNDLAFDLIREIHEYKKKLEKDHKRSDEIVVP